MSSETNNQLESLYKRITNSTLIDRTIEFLSQNKHKEYTLMQLCFELTGKLTAVNMIYLKREMFIKIRDGASIKESNGRFRYIE